MKVALVNIEPKITNTAYMQISHYHKNQGDKVEWYSSLFHREYDRIYCSSLFTFTDKTSQQRKMRAAQTEESPQGI